MCAAETMTQAIIAAEIFIMINLLAASQGGSGSGCGLLSQIQGGEPESDESDV